MHVMQSCVCVCVCVCVCWHVHVHACVLQGCESCVHVYSHSLLSLYRMVWPLWRWLASVLIKMVLLICWVGTLQNLLFYPVILWVELSLLLVTSDAVFCFNCTGTGQHSRPTGHRHWSGQHSRPTGHRHWSGQHYYWTDCTNLWSEKTKKSTSG